MCRLQHHQQKGETCHVHLQRTLKQIDLETSQRHPEARFPGCLGTFLAHLLLHLVCLHALWNPSFGYDTCCSPVNHRLCGYTIIVMGWVFFQNSRKAWNWGVDLHDALVIDVLLVLRTPGPFFAQISQTEARRLWNTWTYTNMYAQNMASLMINVVKSMKANAQSINLHSFCTKFLTCTCALPPFIFLSWPRAATKELTWC